MSESKTSVIAFKGKINGSPLRWFISINEDEFSGPWLTPSEARRLAENLLKACEKIKKKEVRND